MVIVLDKRKRPVGFTTPRRARILLNKMRAVVHKIYPFTIRVKDIDSREFDNRSEYQLKIDVGSKHTGLAIVEQDTHKVCMFLQIEHRAQAISSSLLTRRQIRRNRRSRETRYRHCKFASGCYDTPRAKGWLPPSVKSIPDNIIHWYERLARVVNITKISVEYVKFDTQLMNNPNIQGVEYQQGTLFGYEVRSYLMEKCSHTCQYCGGESGDHCLEVEHIISKRNGGTNKVSNLTIACHTCNADKGNDNLNDYLACLRLRKPSKLDTARVKLIERFLDGQPLQHKNYSAWVNSYRNYLVRYFFSQGIEVELASGGKTSYNRHVLNIEKDHHYDALCIGEIPASFENIAQPCLYIKATGRGNRFRGNTNCCGIIKTKYKNRKKGVREYQSGDIVQAVIPKGKYKGTYTGRITVRSSGYFNLVGFDGRTAPAVNYKYCKLLQRADGYSYSFA